MAVVRVIQEFPDELESDLLEFFGIDLLDLWRGRLSLRRLGVLIKSLTRKPSRSTLLMAMDEAAEWTATDYLLARSSDALELSNYLYLKSNLDEAHAAELEPPDPITRPGTPEPPAPPQPDFATGAELSDFFGRINSL